MNDLRRKNVSKPWFLIWCNVVPPGGIWQFQRYFSLSQLVAGHLVGWSQHDETCYNAQSSPHNKESSTPNVNSAELKNRLWRRIEKPGKSHLIGSITPVQSPPWTLLGLQQVLWISPLESTTIPFVDLVSLLIFLNRTFVLLLSCSMSQWPSPLLSEGLKHGVKHLLLPQSSQLCFLLLPCNSHWFVACTVIWPCSLKTQCHAHALLLPRLEAFLSYDCLS